MSPFKAKKTDYSTDLASRLHLHSVLKEQDNLFVTRRAINDALIASDERSASHVIKREHDGKFFYFRGQIHGFNYQGLIVNPIANTSLDKTAFVTMLYSELRNFETIFPRD